MNIRNRINARKAFVTIVLNTLILKQNANEVNIEGEPYMENLDREFLDQLIIIYERDKEMIMKFIEENLRTKVLDMNQLSLVICGISEIILGTDHKLVIKEYMIISDKTGGNSRLVNAAVDMYYKKSIIS